MKKIVFILGLILVLAACSGGTAVTLQDIPAYPEATALQPGVDPVADTLVDNMAQDAQLRSGIGVGGQTAQMAYRLPAGTSWDQVQSFYNDRLGSDGWESGSGGIAGNLASGIMDSVNQDNDLFQTGIWSKGKQTLTLVRVADTATAEDAFILILSLTTN
jgi:PBP1b-binding outer membrane lipoprotein LpoB